MNMKVYESNALTRIDHNNNSRSKPKRQKFPKLWQLFGWVLFNLYFIYWSSHKVTCRKWRFLQQKFRWKLNKSSFHFKLFDWSNVNAAISKNLLNWNLTFKLKTFKSPSKKKLFIDSKQRQSETFPYRALPRTKNTMDGQYCFIATPNIT